MTDIPMKFAIPILAVVALPLVGALYQFTVPAPQSRQAQTNDNKFAAWVRAKREPMQRGRSQNQRRGI